MSTLDHDVLTALLAKWVSAQESAKEAAAAVTAAKERYDAAQAIMESLKPAFSTLGAAAGTKEGWDALRARLGNDAWVQAVRRGKADAMGPPPAADSKPDEPRLPFLPIPPNSSSESEDEEEFDGTEEDGEGEIDGARPVREMVLEQLELAPDGLTASVLRARIERMRGPLHEKTIGMTLYRLSKDGKTRREGRTWFFVPPAAETENPGGETPGITKSA